MIPLEEAFARMDRALQGRRLETEILPVEEALGRVLAGTPRSLLDLPPFDKSAMDGYALLEGEEGEVLDLAGTIPAGRPPEVELRPGSTVKVMTGAPVPPGTARVVMQEWTRPEGGRIRFLRKGGPPNICWKGEDLGKGDPVLPAGTRLFPAEVGILVSAGVTRVEVYRPLRVEILSTGDEIVDSPEKIGPGKIMDSNGPMLAALASREGMVLTGRGRLRDDLGETVRGIGRALERADFVLLSGGVSEGEFDFVAAALEELGFQVHFDKVSIKPGKPMTFASREGRVVFGLPGNPVSSFVMFHLFVERAAALLAGASPDFPRIRLPLAVPFRRRKKERLEFVPSRLDPSGRVRPLEYHGSAHLGALAGAQGFFLVPRGKAVLEEGEPVEFTAFGRGRW